MDAKLVFCAHSLKLPTLSIPPALSVDNETINFRCPEPLAEAGFPVPNASFTADVMMEQPQSRSIYQRVFATAARDFEGRKNLVVFSYGVRSTPKRQLMFGSESGSGYAAKIIGDVVDVGATKGIFAISAYGVGSSEHLTDFTDENNEMGVIVESVKEGPRVRMVGRVRVTSSEDVRSVFNTVTKNYQKHFESVLRERQPTAELEALPPYMPESMILQLYRYDDEEAFSEYVEANSMTFVALGDSERPVLCGIEEETQQEYEKTQKVLASAVGIISSIRCNRLRIPFGKSKLSQLLRRAYNAEKGNPNNGYNEPTSTVFIIHAFTDAVWAEESYHCLLLSRRVSSVVGTSSIGSITRDLSVDKWRLDQDIMELRDELQIARTVYDYRPCIYDQPKPVQNIREEEQKRISAIVSKREEARERQLSLVREQAKQDADKIIKDLEARTGTTLSALEASLEAKMKENSALHADREKRIHEYEQTLEKIRKKKQEEESACEKLREEMLQLEQELSVRQNAIESKQKNLEMIKLDKSKGRDAVMRERQSIQAMRKTVLEERRRQRKQWINQIKEINAKVIDQVRMLAEERKKNGEQPTANEEAAEKAIIADVRTIEEYLPKLISLEDVPVNLEETEAIRRQFADVFAEEKKTYLARIEEEKARREKLERGLEVYRQRLLDTYQAKKKEKVHDAITKEQHLSSLVDQVITYLRNGVRMSKISSKGNIRRRFYFLSEDYKRIHSCEIDNQGAPISRKKPPVTIWLKDIKKVVIGVYTSSFTNFSSEAQLAKTRQEAVSDSGTYRQDPTQNITSANLGLHNYRSFALLLRGGKSLEVVCETDSDCEAWLVALKRLLQIKSPIERILEERMNGNTTKESPSNTHEGAVDIKWGGSLDIHNMRGFVSLSSEEATLCSENHIPPALFLRMKQEMAEKAERNTITIYDVRVSSGLDLFRSGKLYDFLCEKRVIPLPY
ncbi:hypothetical protein, conserved [Trypanosoma brucei brucei TREU927]|uniref:PH domain-containing protein n=1 Tax=Trypanosoma brucei brucei (strain 927/4 GUTat10.1) TaxID=185431 RepID=Q582W2_TRYB2|nr:hypothetical protein, conserved [Trypanosoma brucei brucei TREU927]AAX80727.1 hypothetical protein, conserved [Trypanosoma brucei]AAZ10284.1 hypothetical protein, conserved [Trypanosoma brucei brucei TREU927]